MTVTRRQNKQIVSTNISSPNLVDEMNSFCRNFVDFIKLKLNECENEISKENKMKVANELYERINSDIVRVLKIDGEVKWILFICTVYNKLKEFEEDSREGNWRHISKDCVDKFLQTLRICKKIVTEIIQNYDGIKSDRDVFVKAKKSLESRQLRFLRRVDYTYMDTIEPECEDDGITDIWADTTLDYDSDYVPYNCKKPKNTPNAIPVVIPKEAYERLLADYSALKNAHDNVKKELDKYKLCINEVFQKLK